MGETGTDDDAGESVSGGIRVARGDGSDEDDEAVEAVAAAADSDDQCAENGEASRVA